MSAGPAAAASSSVNPTLASGGEKAGEACVRVGMGGGGGERCGVVGARFGRIIGEQVGKAGVGDRIVWVETQRLFKGGAGRREMICSGRERAEFDQRVAVGGIGCEEFEVGTLSGLVVSRPG